MSWISGWWKGEKKEEKNLKGGPYFGTYEANFDYSSVNAYYDTVD